METTKFIQIEPDHDCHHDIVGPYNPAKVYKRADDPSNRNLYGTHEHDTVAPLPADEGLHVTRGSPDIYIVNASRAAVVSGYDLPSSAFQLRSELEHNISAGTPLFVNGHGPCIQ